MIGQLNINGKDSVVIKALADMAGVKYDAHYNKYKKAYLKAFEKMLDAMDEAKLTKWKTPEGVVEWWLRE